MDGRMRSEKRHNILNCRHRYPGEVTGEMNLPLNLSFSFCSQIWNSPCVRWPPASRFLGGYQEFSLTLTCFDLPQFPPHLSSDTFHPTLSIWRSSLNISCVCVLSCFNSVSLWLYGWSLPGSSVHGISQAWILEWAAISFSSRSSRPRGLTHISYVSCTGRRVLYN